MPQPVWYAAWRRALLAIGLFDLRTLAATRMTLATDSRHLFDYSSYRSLSAGLLKPL